MKRLDPCSQYFKIQEEVLFNYQLGKENTPRKLAMYLCRVIAQATLEDISIYFKCKTKSGEGNAVSKIKNALQTDKF